MMGTWNTTGIWIGCQTQPKNSASTWTAQNPPPCNFHQKNTRNNSWCRTLVSTCHTRIHHLFTFALLLFYPKVSYYYTSSNNALNASNKHSKAISCKLSNWKIFRLKFSWNQKWTGEKYNLNIQLTIQSVWHSQCKVNKCMCSWNSVFVPFFLGITHISKD